MAEMPNIRALLMLAIAGRSAPDELERQQREHEDDENAAHGRRWYQAYGSADRPSGTH
jgi:hypothetical protein